MCHIDHCYTQILVDMFDLVLHLLTQLLVECPEWLVHQHQLGLENKCSRHGNPLLLTARELSRATTAETFQLDHAQRFIHTLVNLSFRCLSDFERVGQVLADRHVWKQGVVLKDNPDIPFPGRHIVNRSTV